MEYTAVNELGAALAKAQGQIKDAIKDSANPFFKSKYADLASVWAACRKPLSDNGLAVAQCIEVKEGKRWLSTMLLHSSGQYIQSSFDLSLKEESMQAIGSAITYARRYSLSAMVGVCPDDDDDAESAMGRPLNKATVASIPDKVTTPLVPGCDPWIMERVKTLQVNETDFLKYLNETLHIPIETTLEKTLPHIKMEHRPAIAKILNAKEKKV